MNNTYWLFSGCCIWAFILHRVALLLVGKSKKNIPFPFFECILACCLVLLFQSNAYALIYALFFSALGITFVTDFSAMLISRLVSLYLVPVGFLISWYQMIPISWPESIIACLAGYFLLYSINKVFYWYKKQDGIGQGDMDLMAFIGTFTGLLGIWFVLLIGSLLGVVAMFFVKSVKLYIPFGPFLVIGSILFVLFQLQIETAISAIFC